ncbi:hypothetical protein SISSUDRAFT_982041 [Sistotremastrum suecicum HHB10207 ss-3]|uniref:Protein byr4 n=1 Tax=Sistotremastrum suecicum HHB10207 ss-3 TaxID=1314776 RepID=A0A166G5W4_9AGAM|nr:hypothetical protein SISSUDRAFT_982041 [Sistotremastrum suecicum HHB10207 ss-3]
MMPIPAPASATREEWADTDFELPEGGVITSESHESSAEDEDWDVEMDLGTTGGAKASLLLPLGKPPVTSNPNFAKIQLRPTAPEASMEDFDDDDEGISTIKVSALPHIHPKSQRTAATIVEDDIESDFALPTDLSKLSLQPLKHRSSKASFDWTEKEQTSSSSTTSLSSDAYSSLGFAQGPSNSSNSTNYQLETETDEEDPDGELDGVCLPTGLFESRNSGRDLAKILETKKKLPVINERVKVASPEDEEEDFERGLIISDDVHLSPSRLLLAHQEQKLKRSKGSFVRTRSAPTQSGAPSGSALQTREHGKSQPPTLRSKSPINQPSSSRNSNTSPSPRPNIPTRSQTFQSMAFPASSSSSADPSRQPASSSLRGQKSHAGFTSPTSRGFSRKASLSSLMDTSPTLPSTAESSTLGHGARYESSTAASRAKVQHSNSTSRVHAPEHASSGLPPSRPPTPSSNPAALRLTLPTSLRLRSRPAISSVFPMPPQRPDPPPLPRAPSPLPPRPPSSASSRTLTRASQAEASTSNTVLAPKILRKPKRTRTYGDGTELDGIEDLPTDREKERRFRVVPKGTGNRVPGSSYAQVAAPAPPSSFKDTIRRKAESGSISNSKAGIAVLNALRRKPRIDLSTETNDPNNIPLGDPIKKPSLSPPAGPRIRKPTLIRNLNGASVPKVVGDMKWNPETHRWEGNEQVLREFDAAVATSTRPALITHLTGSSLGSPVSNFTSGVRVVGNMMFDPVKMCWLSRLPPEEEEPDVFANMDEDESWEAKGGTIRASQQRMSNASAVSHNSRASQTPSPAHSRARSMSDSGSERGSRPALVVADVDEAFVQACRGAEVRHRVEMRGWKYTRSEDRRDLYYIRELATKKY